jgi:hypothetical protein
MAEALVPGERSATGKFKLIQECLTNNKFEFIWKALKNFKTMSLQVIEGTLKVSKEASIQEHKNQINGTLLYNNDDYSIEVIDKNSMCILQRKIIIKHISYYICILVS